MWIRKSGIADEMWTMNVYDVRARVRGPSSAILQSAAGRRFIKHGYFRLSWDSQPANVMSESMSVFVIVRGE